MRIRTTLASVVVVGVALIGGAAWLVEAHHRALARDVEATAVLRSDDVAAALADRTLPEVLASPLEDETVVQVVGPDGAVVAASSNITGEAPITGLSAPVDGHTARTLTGLPVGDTAFRVIARRGDAAHQATTIYVGRSLEPAVESTQDLQHLLLTGTPLLVGLVAITTWFVTGRALLPVDEIRREVEQISGSDLHRRVPEPPTHDEINRLAVTMNTMLERLDTSNEKQRRLVTDTSHELRSPLAAIRAQLEIDGSYPDPTRWRVTRTEVLDETIRLQQLIDDLLLLAKPDSTDATGDQKPLLDLDDIVLAAVRRAQPGTDKVINTSHVNAGQIEGNTPQLERLVTNLLDNAIRHATTAITVALREVDKVIELTVADDGPGIRPADRHRIFEPFTRLDADRGRDSGGTGLGLAIASDIVRVHQGTIAAEDAQPGARFVVSLPAPKRHPND
ncbi:MAG: HAMP domain-containing sensor histidine kinase [Aquihabitans sp.]